MGKIMSNSELVQYRENISVVKDKKIRILVGMATCGIAAGSGPVMDALVNELKEKNVDAQVVSTGCLGYCYAEPLVEVVIDGVSYLYGKVDVQGAKDIVNKHVIGGNAIECSLISKPRSAQSPLSDGMVRIALRNSGIINPDVINDYIKADGYKALAKAITELKPEDIIDTVKKSGLRGRGGGGFPTGLKWEIASKNQADLKYIVCNADEGDPGAFMDRSILEGDPHSVLEAMAIAGYAIGANKGVIYIRAEYPLAVKRLETAIKQARELGLLGENILGSGFSFDITLSLGSGAFVCGEETALLNSIEGNRGEPTVKPPFPAEKGLWQKPTCINNVETYANVCPIINNGHEWFSSIGSEKSKGTKVFALAGKVNHEGLVEVPMGIKLRDIIYNIGGGIKDGKSFKAVLTGGPSGGCIPEELLDTPIEYESLIAIGSMMGSGGMIVLDEDDCMVNIAKFYLGFTVDESCGKCTPCRIGNKRLYELLEDITTGKGTPEHIEKLTELGTIIKDCSLCGLGQTSPNPVLSTLNYFRDEYMAHVTEKTCKAKACTSLMKYLILEDKCTGCTICARNCPVPCIEGERKKTHVIDQEKCIKCGICYAKCPFGAIIKD